ncbi:hypothetical protein SCODD09_01324 [Streptococcus constellatus]|nr:hypothetical protein SCODD09_01324 [Streptococcus constellatus]
MFKNEVKGHGTIKKLRTGAVVSVLALSSVYGVSTTVSADEVGTGAKESIVKTVENPDAKTDAPVAKVTEQQVTEAKSEADTANKAVEAQQGVVTKAETAVAEANQVVTETAEQIKAVDTVTPKDVETAKAEAEAKANALAKANEAVKSAEQSQATTAEKVASQTNVVNQAQAEVTKTASAVADAQKKVDDLSNSSTDTTKLQKDVDDLTKKVDDDQKALDTAKQSLDTAKSAEANKAKAIEDAKKVVDGATQAADSAKQALDVAKSTEANSTKKVEDAKKALDVAKAGVVETTTTEETRYNVSKSTYSPVLTKEYIDALKALANGTGTSSDVRKAIRKAYTDENGVGANSLREYNSTGSHMVNGVNVPYGSEDGDTTEIADFQNLTTEQRTKLSIYAASILNELRAKVGTAPLAASETSVLLAGELDKKERYFKTSNAWEGEQTGSTYSNTLKDNLTQTEKEQGITEKSTAIQGGMITKFSGKDVKKYTMAELKQLVYQGIVNTLMGANENSDSEDVYSSAMYMLGLKGAEKSNVGVSLAFEFAQGYPNSFIATFVLSPTKTKTETKTVVDEAAVAKAQTAYDQALQASNTAKATLAQAQTAYDNATQALTVAQQQLSDLIAGNVDIPALEKAVVDAQAQLDADKASLQSAKETLAVAKASAVDKANALSKAQAELVKAKSLATQAKGVLAQAQEELAILNKANEVATLALSSAKEAQGTAKTASDSATARYTELAKALTDKPAVLAKLNAKLADAKAKASVLRAELETAQDELTKLKADAKVKEEAYRKLADLKAKQDEAEKEAKRLQDLKDKEATIRNNGGEPKAVLDDKGNVIDYVDAKAQNVVVPTVYGGKAPVKASLKKQEKQLPNTGEESSNATALAVIIAVTALGLVAKNKRKKS